MGAGIWIETVVALRELKLDPKKDDIQMVPIGGPPEILKALAADNIDAALLPQAQTESLKAKGYTVLLDQYPPNLYVYENGLIVSSMYALAHPEVVAGVLDALVEAVHFIHQPNNKDAVIQALGLALKLPNGPALEQRYNELKGLAESPYPSIDTLKRMQTLVSYHDPAVLNVRIETFVDDESLNRLDGAEPKVH